MQETLRAKGFLLPRGPPVDAVPPAIQPPPPWAPSVRNVAVYTPKDRPRPTPFQAHRRGRTPLWKKGPFPRGAGPCRR